MTSSRKWPIYLLARGANLKIQAVLNKRWQTFLLLIFLFLRNKYFFSDARKTRNKYTRFSHSHIPFVVYFTCVREGGVIACVAGAKRGGERRKARTRRKPSYPLSPIPLLFPPYPLPVSTPGTQARGVTTKLSLKNLALILSGGIREDCKARGFTGQQKKFLYFTIPASFIRGWPIWDLSNDWALLKQGYLIRVEQTWKCPIDFCYNS